jgi:threonine aldolase
VSITQSTELGTLYTLDEVRSIADTAHELGMYLHMDGARICNAAASLDVELRETTADVGVDLLSFGGTKNGLMGGEAVVVLRPELAENTPFIRKQQMQLASKMRFISAQFLALFENDLWRHNATHANAMALRLRDAVADIPGVTITQKVQANGVFAILPQAAIPKLQEAYHFYTWDEASHEVRWMCSWDTTEDDIDSFARLVAEIVPASS